MQFLLRAAFTSYAFETQRRCKRRARPQSPLQYEKRMLSFADGVTKRSNGPTMFRAPGHLPICAGKPMADLLPSWPLLTAFLAASLVLAITPGPAVLYIVTRSMIQGRSSGLASVAGVALGNLGNAIGASAGLAALFAASSLAFLIVKYAGALYLIYLGVRALRAPAAADVTPERMEAVSLARVFRDGFVVALFNPKTAVFFAAFLPQFMHLESVSMLQSAVLGALFVAVAATTDTAYALAASAVAPTLTRRGALFSTLGRYLSGSVFIGLGVLAACTGTRAQK